MLGEKAEAKIASTYKRSNSIGVGEVFLNSIDRDGEMTAFDLEAYQINRK